MSLIVGSSVAISGNSAPTGATPSAPIQTAFNSGASLTSLTVNFSTNTTAGNTIVVCLGTAGNTNPTVTGITIGGVADNFQRAGGLNNDAYFNSEIWYDTACVGGQTSVVISFTHGTGSPQTAAQIYEVSGGLWVDVTSANAGATIGAWSSTVSIAPTTTHAKEIMFGAVLASNSISATGTGTWTPSCRY